MCKLVTFIPCILGLPSVLGTMFLERRVVVRGEAIRDNPVPVPQRASINDESRVLSFGPLMCGMNDHGTPSFAP